MDNLLSRTGTSMLEILCKMSSAVKVCSSMRMEMSTKDYLVRTRNMARGSTFMPMETSTPEFMRMT